MSQDRLDTRTGTRAVGGPIMLGVLIMVSSFGCAGHGGRSATGPASFAPTGTVSSRPPNRNDEHRGPSRVARRANDPGADALVDSIRAAMGSDIARSPGAIRVGVAGLRNQSHASNAEFAGLQRTLADLLTDAGVTGGGGPPLRFVTTTEDLDYELTGAAYLTVRDGMDQWELYLVLRPADRAWVIWRADEPVRLLRQPRGGTTRLIFE